MDKKTKTHADKQKNPNTIRNKKIESHEPNQNLGMISSDTEGFGDSAPHVDQMHLIVSCFGIIVTKISVNLCKIKIKMLTQNKDFYYISS